MGNLSYRDKTGHIVTTAADVMAVLLGLIGDFGPEDLPSKSSGRYDRRTAEAQALVDHVHSGNFKEGDKLFDDLMEQHNYLAELHCRISASIVYEYAIEPNEEGVATEGSYSKGLTS